MKEIKFNSIRIALVSLCFPFFLTGILFGSKPVVNISATAVTPRFGMLEYEESTYWNSVVNYAQHFGRRFSVESQFEYGSETGSLPNPFRVYNLTTKLDLGRHALRIGRIAHWSRLSNARVDGVDYTLSTSKFGALRFLGGFNAVTDFSDTSFTDKIFILTSWSTGRIGNNADLAYWMEMDGEETNSYIGGSTSKKIFLDIRFTSTLAWSISTGQIYHGKIKLAKRFGKNVLTLGLRQKRFLIGEPYHWVDTSYNPSPVVNLGLTTRVGQDLIVWNQFNHRLNEDGVSYLRSTVLFDVYSITTIISTQGDKTLLGTSIGAKHSLTKNLNAGGSLALNTLSYGDIIEPAYSVGGYWWIAWQPADKISMRFFTRYYKSPYFKYDGRGGLVINVAI